MLSRLLAPRLRAHNRRAVRRWETIPRPTDRGPVHTSGSDPDRILVVGSGPVTGWGVRTHELGLPGQLARRLTELTGRATDIDLCTAPSLPIRLARSVLEDVRLERYDAVVLSVGVEDALGCLSLTEWEERLRELLAQVATASTTVVVLGIQPITSLPEFANAAGAATDVHARRMNRITRALCTKRPRFSYISLPAPVASDRAGGCPAAYDSFARLIAPLLAATMRPARGGRPALRRFGPDDEAARLLALHRMELPEAGTNPALQRILRLACRMLDTPHAAITLIGATRQTYHSQVGQMLPDVDRRDSFCGHTIQQDEAMIVPDARQDARFVANPLVTQEPGVRYYAGFPIESPDGYRIGALCVSDSAPHPARGSDGRALRDLAKLAQRELSAEAARQPKAPRP